MKFILDCIRGVFIGIANAIPGVSGGTMMVSMGIYDSIIGSITNLFHDVKRSIWTLLPYAVGMAAGIVGLSYAIKFLLGSYPFQTSMLFIGLILGGVPVLWKHVNGTKISAGHLAIFVIFFCSIIALQLVGGGDGAGEAAALEISALEVAKLFFVGNIAAATMVVPGVSGAMILMILGYYYPIITQVTDFIHALLEGNLPSLLHGCGILIPFGIGVLVGIFAIAKLIEALLTHYKSHTYAGILGLVMASPVVILMSNGLPAFAAVTIGTGIAAFAAGFFVAKALSD